MFAIVCLFSKKMKDLPFKKRCTVVNELIILLKSSKCKLPVEKMMSNSKVVEISRRNSLLEDPFFQKHHRLDNYLIPILRDESCTSLKADLRQGFGKLTQKRRFVLATLLIWINVPMS